MKRLFLALLSFSFISAGAQTAEDIIQKYAANMGRLDAFNNIKTAKITGTYSVQGMDLPLTAQIINGKAYRSDVKATDLGMTIINVYNNGKGWKQNPLGGAPSPVEMTTTELDDFKQQSKLAPPLMDYKARGYKAALAGKEIIEGIDTWKIKLTATDNKVTTYYISASDHVLIKSELEREMQGQTVKVETWYSDLKDFNGIKFFMVRDQKMQGTSFQTTTYSDIELNVTIDEKIFNKPG